MVSDPIDFANAGDNKITGLTQGSHSLFHKQIDFLLDRWDQRDRGYYRTAGHWERDHDFKPAKVKKDKKHKDRDDEGHGEGKHHGKGNKHDG